MSKYFFTSQDLINSVKRRASIPDSQSMITDAEILEFANEEMELNVIPLIVAKHEDYFLTREDVAVVSNQQSYAIPYRAIGSQLRNLCVSDENSNELGSMSRIPLEEAMTHSRYGNQSFGNRRYYIQNENVVILGNNSNDLNADYLSFFYNLSPNKLVASTRVAIITQIDEGSGQIIVDRMPDNFTLTSEYDFVKTRAPHKILTYDIAVSDIDVSNKLITFNTQDLPDQLRVGDRIAISGETDVVNCPSELHVMLAQSVAARILESIGDNENLQMAERKLKKMEDNAANILDNRVSGSPIKAKPTRFSNRRRRR